uniref:Uncharacterized protein n=1 Tax=Schizaphis graminum TaxID=13262 RepID=A0A2S2P0B9_SCHGA
MFILIYYCKQRFVITRYISTPRRGYTIICAKIVCLRRSPFGGGKNARLCTAGDGGRNTCCRGCFVRAERNNNNNNNNYNSGNSNVPPPRRAMPSPTRATTTERTGFSVRAIAVARLLCSARMCVCKRRRRVRRRSSGTCERTCGVERYSPSSSPGGRGVEIPQRNRMGRAV